MIRYVWIFSLLYLPFGHECQTLRSTPSGSLEGSIVQAPNRKNVTVYLGVPYAQPPIGELRFQAPKEAKPWTGTLQAKQAPKACIQGSNRGKLYPQFDVFLPDGTETSEDCLYLNIWVPEDKPPEGAAVMIFVHGGSNLNGAGSVPLYDGGILSSEERVIVITFNYRLGLFGYLFGDDHLIPGNMASMDQALAFKWVRDNIAAFGGDPNRVTIFGQSSGSSAVTLHPLLPSSKGLFNGVIGESLTILASRAFYSKTKSLLKFKSLSDAVGCRNSSSQNRDVALCLRNKSVQELVNASSANAIKYSLTMDRKYFPKHPRDLIKEGNINKSIAFLLGHNSADAYQPNTIGSGIFVNTSNFQASKEHFEENILKVINGTSEDVKNLESLYTNGTEPDGKNYRRPLVDFVTDVRYTCVINEYSDLATLNGNPVYKYEYSYVASVTKLYPWQEVAHSYELYFVFGLPLNPSLGYSQSDQMFSKKIMSFWASIAKFGTPNGNETMNTQPCNDKWPIYTVEKKENFILDVESAVVNGLSLEKCSYLKKISKL